MPAYIKGDLFSHRGRGETKILAHACNPFGRWGGGIAAQFRQRYPDAYRIYAEHCQKHDNLLGSCLLISTTDVSEINLHAGTIIACLFTSDFECNEKQILEYTDQAMEDLTQQLSSMKDIEKDDRSGRPVVNMPQINSGIFKVAWEKTAAVLESHKSLVINVYTL